MHSHEAVMNLENRARFPEWITSVLLGFALLGGYYCYQAFSTMIQPLRSIMSEEWVDAIPIVYHTAAVFAVLFSVPLIRRLGLKGSLAVTTFICLTGALLALPTSRSLLAGRLVLGLGLEPLGVTILAAARAWLSPIHRALYLGVILSLGRLGFVFADLTPVVGITDWRAVEYSCVIFAAVSFLIGVVLYFKEDATLSAGQHPAGAVSSRLYLVLVVISTFFFASVLIFRMYGDDFFYHQYGIPLQSAARLIGVTSVIPLFGSIPFGRLADRMNRHAWFIVGGCLLLSPSYLLLGLSHGNRETIVFSLILVGLAYAIVPSSLWSSVGMVVGGEKILVAYSQVLGTLNAAMAVAYSLHLLIRSAVQSQPLIWLVGICSTIATLASLLFTIRSKRANG